MPDIQTNEFGDPIVNDYGDPVLVAEPIERGETESTSKEFAKNLAQTAEQAGIGLTRGFADLGAGANKLLELRERISLDTPTVTGKVANAIAGNTSNLLAEQFKGASEVARKEAQLLEQVGQETEGPEFARKLAAGAVSIVPAIAAGPMGIPAAITASALTSFADTFQSAEEAALAQGLTPDEARKRATIPAVASGLATAAITAVGGKIAPGVEGFAQSVATKGFKDAAVKILVNAGAEATEEAVDELAQSAIEVMSFNPNLTPEQAFERSVDAFKIGGLLGGTLSTASMASSPQVQLAESSFLPATAEVLKATPPPLPSAEESFAPRVIQPDPNSPLTEEAVEVPTGETPVVQEVNEFGDTIVESPVVETEVMQDTPAEPSLTPDQEAQIEEPLAAPPVNERASLQSELDEELGQVEEVESETKSVPIGEDTTVMGINVQLDERQVSDNIEHEIYSGKGKDKRAVLRVRDLDSGEVVVLKTFPDFDSAAKEYETTIKANGGTPSSVVVPKKAATKPTKAKATQSEKAFNATAEGQKIMANKASRIATLHTVNSAIRRIDQNEAWSESLIDATPDSQIDSMLETMRETYNALLAKNKKEAPQLVARTAPVQRADVDNGTRQTEYRTRKVSEAEAMERRETFRFNRWVVERRTVKKDLDTGTVDDGEWVIVTVGETANDAMMQAVDSQFMEAESLTPQHEAIAKAYKAETGFKRDKQNRLDQAIREVRWAESSVISIQNEGNKKYRTAVKRAKGDEKKVKVAQEKLLAEFKPQLDKAKENLAKAIASQKAIEAESFNATQPEQSTADKAVLKVAEFIDQPIEGKEALSGIPPVSKPQTARKDIIVAPADLRSDDPKVEARWQNARLTRRSLFQKAKELAVHAKNAFMQRYPKLESKTDGQLMNTLRVHEAAPHYAQTMAATALHGITRNLGPNGYNVFSRLVILPDLLKDIDRGMYAGKDLPFGYTNRDAVQADMDKFQRIADQSPELQQAIQRRTDFIHALRDDLVKRDLLPPQVQDFDDYFHRQVLEYQAMKDSVTVGTSADEVRNQTQGWQRKRTGSSKDYNTSYLESEFEVIAQALAQIETQNTLARLQAQADIKPDLQRMAKAQSKQSGKDVTWEELIPSDYTTWQPERGNHFYWANTLTDRALESYLRDGKVLTRDDFRKALAMGGPKTEWVIPKRLAETLDKFGPRPDNMAEKAMRLAQNAWKRWTLFNPMRTLIYQLNNVSGDMDIAIAYNPKILGYTKQAGKDLWKFNVAQGTVNAEQEFLLKQGVIGSGFTSQEIPDVQNFEFAAALEGKDQNLIKKYWNTVLNFNQWRENVLRVAAYRFFKDRLAAGHVEYGASPKAEVDAIADPNEKAAKLARELVGDYGNISRAGEYIRSKLIPFYAWMEINAPRYVRMFNNLPVQGKARQAALLTARASALFLLVTLWNKIFFPDEEDEMQGQRNQQHIILGRREDGSIISLRFQGALSDALDWFGAGDLPEDVADLSQGKADVGDKIIEAAKAPVNRILNAAQPFAKALVEAGTKRSFFPDVFNPKTVRDSFQPIARLLSVGTVYDYLTKKPQRPHTWGNLAALITYTTDPGEAAYMSSRSMVSKWRDDNKIEGATIIPNDRSNALYYYKQAIKYKDEKLEAYWKKQYMDMGGKKEGLKQSVQRADPLSGLTVKQKKQFLQSLDPQEKEILERGQQWYKKTY